MSFDFTDKELAIVKSIGKVADSLQYETYVVGGFVRDRIINRNTKDIDIVCVGDGIKLAQKVEEALDVKQKLVVFKRFGTAMLKFDDLELEFVGARKESYSQDSRKPDVEPGTLNDDQLRRDFTINALAVCLNENRFGELIDPFNGLDDLAKGIIKTPTDPDKTFSDDPLRMMRAVRFASQLDFEILPETFEGIQRNSHRLEIISAERITQELNKIILSKVPSKGFELLSQAKLLNVFFPEFEKLRGVEIINNIGHKDNYYHTLKVLDNLSEVSQDLWLRWAAILHDIAKPPPKDSLKAMDGHSMVMKLSGHVWYLKYLKDLDYH